MKKMIFFGVILFNCIAVSHAQDIVKVKETNTIPGGNGYPFNLTSSNNKLFFTSNDNTNFNSLWVTEGTEATTQMLGPSTPVKNSVRNLISYKNKLYFSCDDGINGQEVWVSDGTVTGTSLFKDVYTGSAGSYPEAFTVANNKLFFMTYGADGIKRLYGSDGTSAGTVLLKNGIDIFNGFTNFAILNNDIYFRSDDGTGAGYGLWKSNGTAGGTSLVTNVLTPGVSGGNYAVLNNKLYFSGFDYTTGSELWVTDGSTLGTHMVVNLGKDYGGILYSGSPQNLVVYNSKLYFNGWDSAHGSELFVTNGTAAGTQLVKDVIPGTDGSQPQITVYNGLLYIIFSTLQQLWKSDGTAVGTELVRDILPYSKFAAIWNNKIYFTNNYDYLVWESDGSTAGTGPLKVQNTNNSVYSYGADYTFTQHNTELYFSGQCAGITGGYELCKLTVGAAAVTTFTFTGSGNWSNPANWSGGIVPPATLASGYSVIINGQCILDVAIVAQSGSSITVKAGKSLLILGSLTII
ncbi:MAG: ELWxxDGT repeat protein [Ginsengibacter sp.]